MSNRLPRNFSIVVSAAALVLTAVFIGCADAEDSAPANATDQTTVQEESGSTSSAATSAAAEEAPEAYTQKIAGTDLSFDMVPIPGGTLKMGSPEDADEREDDEGPQFEVEIEPFWMGKYEVTQESYDFFLDFYSKISDTDPRPVIPNDKLADAVSVPTPIYEQEVAPKLQLMGGRGGKYPAVIMSQLAAKQYCKWLSKKTGYFYRLPTEAEWEYAARAGTTTAFSFGDDLDDLEDHGWYFDNSELDSGEAGYRMVGLKKPNPWGLYDMHGNVSEWVIDAYAEDWYANFEGRKVGWQDAINWPKERYPCVMRGGSWDKDAEDCRSASRFASNRNMNVADPQLPQSPWWVTNNFDVGFRIIRPVKEPSEEEKLRYWESEDAYIREEVLTRDREVKMLVDQQDQLKKD